MCAVCSAEYHLHRLTVLGTGLSMVDTSIHSSPEEVQDHDLLVCQIQFNNKSMFTPYLVSETPMRSSGYRQHLRPGSTFFLLTAVPVTLRLVSKQRRQTGRGQADQQGITQWDPFSR